MISYRKKGQLIQPHKKCDFETINTTRFFFTNRNRCGVNPVSPLRAGQYTESGLRFFSSVQNVDFRAIAYLNAKLKNINECLSKPKVHKM